MFTGISRRYDLANRILSFGCDKGWRRRLITTADPQQHERVLDIATGTADLICDFSQTPNELDLVGLDISRGMLEVGSKKISRNGLRSRSILVEADALQLPFESNSMNVISIAFGLRNLVDRKAGIAEMARVLDKRGRLVILEFSLPDIIVWKQLYLVYLKYFMPIVGGWLTGSREAYQYLHDSIRAFPSPVQIREMMEQSGLKVSECQSLMGGIATLYKGVKG